jgi:glycosyltransferase involved in cell wall biosynthesis
VHPPGIEYLGYFPKEKKQLILSRADLLVLPINFDELSQIYINYSFQTKLPEYMASGTPILMYGPPSNPNIKYGINNEFAAVVTERDLDNLSRTILSLYSNENFRESLGKKARYHAFRNHDAKLIRDEFQKLLIDLS